MLGRMAKEQRRLAAATGNGGWRRIQMRRRTTTPTAAGTPTPPPAAAAAAAASEAAGAARRGERVCRGVPAAGAAARAVWELSAPAWRRSNAGAGGQLLCPMVSLRVTRPSTLLPIQVEF